MGSSPRTQNVASSENEPGSSTNTESVSTLSLWRLPGLLLISAVLVWLQPWTLESRLSSSALDFSSGGFWRWRCRSRRPGLCKPLRM